MGFFYKSAQIVDELEMSSKLRSVAMKTISLINQFKKIKNTLEGEIERNQALLTEFQQRTKGLAAATKKKAETPTSLCEKT